MLHYIYTAFLVHLCLCCIVEVQAVWRSIPCGGSPTRCPQNKIHIPQKIWCPVPHWFPDWDTYVCARHKSQNFSTLQKVTSITLIRSILRSLYYCPKNIKYKYIQNCIKIINSTKPHCSVDEHKLLNKVLYRIKKFQNPWKSLL